jgi:hypothetical protein
MVDVLMAVSMNIRPIVFWDMTPCGHFVGTLRFYLQGRKLVSFATRIEVAGDT